MPFIPCDRCRHRSKTAVAWDGGKALVFCGHHMTRYKPFFPKDALFYDLED